MTKKVLLLAFLVLPLLNFAQQINQTDEHGNKQGIWEKKQANGKLIYSGNFKDNYPIGNMKRFHANGNLKAELFFTNKGQKTKANLYNESAQLIAQGNFIQSKKDSVWVYFDKNKNIRASEAFDKGIKNGKSIYYFKNGKTAETINFLNDKRNGAWKRFFENGKPYLEANYSSGNLNGITQSYYSNGLIEYGGSYKNNQRDGNWDFYSNKGELLFSIEYKNGIASNQDELDKIQQAKLKEMEKKKAHLIDPERFVDDPDAYLRTYNK